MASRTEKRMARRTTFEYYDDLDGTPIEAGNTVTFSLEGRTYEIDLSDINATGLRNALAPFVSVARRVRDGSARAGSRAR